VGSEMIYMIVIKVKKGMQWDRCEISVVGNIENKGL
jgi:hypothetical protein